MDKGNRPRLYICSGIIVCGIFFVTIKQTYCPYHNWTMYNPFGKQYTSDDKFMLTPGMDLIDLKHECPESGLLDLSGPRKP